ncbi:hypothetical protein LSUCC0031_06220 [Rhodobacterales bacterium LSUCC0031]|nr:hypothetical protein [Rhodobacterales bacterium LSUCC0031]
MAAKDTEKRPAKSPSDPRAARLKAALKANLARRKQQARARAIQSGADDENDTPAQTGPNLHEQ